MPPTLLQRLPREMKIQDRSQQWCKTPSHRHIIIIIIIIIIISISIITNALILVTLNIKCCRATLQNSKQNYATLSAYD